MSRIASKGLALALLTVLGCGRDQLRDGNQKSSDLRIVPAAFELYRDQDFSFDVVRRTNEGEASVLREEGLSLDFDESIVTVDKNGTGKAVGPGETLLGATYIASSAEAGVTVRDATLTGIRIEAPANTLAIGATMQLRVWADLSDGSSLDVTGASSGTTYSSDFETIATVSESGVVTGRAPGDVTITAMHAGQSAAVTLEVSTTATDLVELRMEPDALSLPFGDTQQLRIIGVLSDGSEVDILANLATYPLTISSSDPSVAAVSATALVTAGVVPGRAVITAQVGDVVDVTDVEVRPPGDQLLFIEVRPNPLRLGVGDRGQLTVVGFYSDGSQADLTFAPETNYQSVDARVATVDAVGTVEGRSPGNTLVIVRHSAFQERITVEVDQNAVLIDLIVTPPELQMDIMDVERLQVTAIFSDGSMLDVTSQCTYAEPADSIVDVSNTGIVTALRPGAGDIRVSYRGLATFVPVIVGDATIVGIEIVPNPIRLAENDIRPVRIEAILANGGRIEVTADPRTNITVADMRVAGWDGFAVLGFMEGRTTLRATFMGFSATAPIVVTSSNQLIGISLSVSAVIPLGQTRPYTVTALFSDGSTQNVTSMAMVATSNPNVLRVNGGATVTGLNAGTATLDAFFGGFADTQVIRVTSVNDPVVAITFQPRILTIPVNSADTTRLIGTTASGAMVDLTADPGVSYAITGGINISVGPPGLQVFGVSPGPAEVTATYNGLTARASVNVTGGTMVVDLQIIVPATMPVNTSATYFVIAIFSDGSTLDVTNDPMMMITSANPRLSLAMGLVFAQQVGLGTLDASYQGVNTSQNIQVTSGMDPVVSIAWQPTSLNMNPGDSEPVRLIATLMSGMMVDITFDPLVIYNPSGPITGSPGPGGTILITAQAAGNASVQATYQGQSATLPITINNTGPTVIGLILRAPPNLDMGVPGTYSVIARYSDGTSSDVTFDPGVMVFVQNPAIFTAANGVLTPVSPGTTGLGVTFMGFSAMRQITVHPNNNPVVALQWTPGALMVGVGSSQTAQLLGIRMTGPPIDLSHNPGVTYTTTGPITLAPAGIGMAVTGVAPGGPAQVTATFNGLNANLPVTVGTTPTLIGIRIDPGVNINLTVGGTQQLTVIGLYSDGSEAPVTGAVFINGDPSVTSVTPGGLVTGVGPGMGSILVAFGMFAEIVTVNVTAPAPTIMAVSPNAIAVGSPPTPITVTGGNFINGNVVRLNGMTVPTTFVSGARLDAIVPAGLLTSPGMITVQVTGTNGSSNIVRITVGEAPNVISYAPTRVIMGSSVEVTAVGTGLTALTFTPATGLTVMPVAAAPDGTWVRFRVTAANNIMPGPYAVDLTNTFGTDTITMTVEPASGLPNLVVTAGQTLTLSGTNVYNTVTVQTGGRIEGIGNEPLAIIAAGGITIRGAIDVSGTNGAQGFTNPAAGGAAGPGGAGGGGGGDGNAPTGGTGGAGMPAGFDGDGGFGAGTPAGDGGGTGGGVGAAGGCGEGGGGGALGGAGGDGGGDMGVGTGGPGGNPGAGSAFGAGTGGGGATTCGGNSGGGGGGGGGMLILETSLGATILIDGTLTADGGDGGDGFSGTGGGGGGSGGRIEVRAPGGTIVVNDTIAARGGTGGDSDFGDTGGGGGGGIIIVTTAPGGMINASLGFLEAQGGAPGASLGGGNAGTTGAQGIEQVTP